MFIAAFRNCKKLEATEMFFSRWMNNQTVVHPDNACYLSINKNYQATKRCGRTLTAYCCDSSYMTLWEKQNCEDNKKISGCQ